jgi:hypothetical protein
MLPPLGTENKCFLYGTGSQKLLLVFKGATLEKSQGLSVWRCASQQKSAGDGSSFSHSQGQVRPS